MNPPNLYKRTQLTGHRGAIYGLIATESGLWSAGGDGWVVHWPNDPFDTGKVIANIGTSIYSLAMVLEHNWVIAGDMNGGIHWINLADATKNRDIQHHKKGVFSLVSHQNFLFSAGGDGCLTCWDAIAARSIETLQLSTKSLRCIALHPTLSHLAVGASDGNIYIIDTNTRAVIRTIQQAHLPAVFCVRYSPDGQQLLSGGRDAHLRVWEVPNNYAPICALPAHKYTLNDIVFLLGGRQFATVSRDRTIKIWEADTFTLLRVVDTLRQGNHINSVNKIALLPDGSLVSCSDDRSIIVWDIALGS